MAVMSPPRKKQPAPPKPPGGPVTSVGQPTPPQSIKPIAPIAPITPAAQPVAQPMGLGVGATPAAPTAPITTPATAKPTKAAPLTPATNPSSSYYSSRSDDPAALAAEIASEDSMLMTQARADGSQQAASRGMLNSSMAAEAAQGAVLDVAVPLAQQGASQEFQKNMSGLGLQQQMELAQFEARTGMKMARFDAGTQMALLNAEMIGDAALQRELLATSQAFEAEQAAFARELEVQLAGLDLTAADKQGAETAMLNAFNDYNQMVASIQANPNLSAEERTAQIEAQQQFFDMRVNYINDLYSTAFDWPDNPWDSGTAPNSGTNTTSGGDIVLAPRA